MLALASDVPTHPLQIFFVGEGGGEPTLRRKSGHKVTESHDLSTLEIW